VSGLVLKIKSSKESQKMMMFFRMFFLLILDEEGILRIKAGLSEEGRKGVILRNRCSV
jgi:hypothetical protein